MEAGNGLRAHSGSKAAVRVPAQHRRDAIEFDEIDEYSDDAWGLIGVIEREGRLLPELGDLDL